MRYFATFLLTVFTAFAQEPSARPSAPLKIEPNAVAKPFGRRYLPADAVAQPAAAVIGNAASFLPGISPGGLSTIIGKNLTHVNGVIVANTDPLPTLLGNISIRVNGRSAPIFSVSYDGSQDQISFQVPYKTATGRNAAEVQVFDGPDLVADLITDSFTEDPGIFIYQGKYAVSVHGVDNALVGPSYPAAPGEVIVVYATGLGRLTLDLQDGYGAPGNLPGDPLARTIDPFLVLVNGQACQVLFSGLGPGFVGLYQLNIVLPRNLPVGNLELSISSDYGNSNIAILPVY